jgi:hypothetical protein
MNDRQTVQDKNARPFFNVFRIFPIPKISGKFREGMCFFHPRQQFAFPVKAVLEE